ncbi:MAG: hypothetical protein RJA13_1121 [Bacteroidota bacterium]|jgi:hypothetical protein
MLKKYPQTIAQSKELKIGPSKISIETVLNFSRSLEVKKSKKDYILVHLN